MKRTFTKDELIVLDFPWRNVAEVHVENTRWSVVNDIVFKADDRHWMIRFASGATEAQDYDDFEEKDEFEATEVEEREVAVLKWVPVEVEDES
jgi:hypothetical protein